MKGDGRLHVLRTKLQGAASLSGGMCAYDATPGTSSGSGAPHQTRVWPFRAGIRPWQCMFRKIGDVQDLGVGLTWDRVCHAPEQGSIMESTMVAPAQDGSWLAPCSADGAVPWAANEGGDGSTDCPRESPLNSSLHGWAVWLANMVQDPSQSPAAPVACTYLSYGALAPSYDFQSWTKTSEPLSAQVCVPDPAWSCR